MARRQITLREKRLMSGLFGALAAVALIVGTVCVAVHNSDYLPAFVLTVVWVIAAYYYWSALTKPDSQR
jgi:uncharacterized RDD family membrane protein YckC